MNAFSIVNLPAAALFMIVSATVLLSILMLFAFIFPDDIVITFLVLLFTIDTVDIFIFPTELSIIVLFAAAPLLVPLNSVLFILIFPT